MRLVGSIPHARFKVVVYALEHHFYVEIEAGPMKQCYKLPKERVTSLSQVQEWLDESFSEAAYRRFEDMYRSHTESLERHFPQD